MPSKNDPEKLLDASTVMINKVYLSPKLQAIIGEPIIKAAREKRVSLRQLRRTRSLSYSIAVLQACC